MGFFDILFGSNPNDPLGLVDYEGVAGMKLDAYSMAWYKILDMGGFENKTIPLDEWLNNPDNLPEGTNKQQYVDVLNTVKDQIKTREAVTGEKHELPPIYILKAPTVNYKHPVSGKQLNVEELIIEMGKVSDQMENDLAFFDKFVPKDVQNKLRNNTQNPNAWEEHTAMLKQNINTVYSKISETLVTSHASTLYHHNAVTLTGKRAPAIIEGAFDFNNVSPKAFGWTIAHEAGHHNLNISYKEAEVHGINEQEK